MFINFLRTDKRATFILLLLRLYIGYTWLAAGIGKVFGQSFDASGFLKGAIAQASGDHPAVQSWWADFLSGIFITETKWRKWLNSGGERGI